MSDRRLSVDQGPYGGKCWPFLPGARNPSVLDAYVSGPAWLAGGISLVASDANYGDFELVRTSTREVLLDSSVAQSRRDSRDGLAVAEAWNADYVVRLVLAAGKSVASGRSDPLDARAFQCDPASVRSVSSPSSSSDGNISLATLPTLAWVAVDERSVELERTDVRTGTCAGAAQGILTINGASAAANGNFVLDPGPCFHLQNAGNGDLELSAHCSPCVLCNDATRISRALDLLQARLAAANALLTASLARYVAAIERMEVARLCRLANNPRILAVRVSRSANAGFPDVEVTCEWGNDSGVCIDDVHFRLTLSRVSSPPLDAGERKSPVYRSSSDTHLREIIDARAIGIWPTFSALHPRVKPGDRSTVRVLVRPTYTAPGYVLHAGLEVRWPGPTGPVRHSATTSLDCPVSADEAGTIDAVVPNPRIVILPANPPTNASNQGYSVSYLRTATCDWVNDSGVAVSDVWLSLTFPPQPGYRYALLLETFQTYPVVYPGGRATLVLSFVCWTHDRPGVSTFDYTAVARLDVRWPGQTGSIRRSAQIDFRNIALRSGLG